MLERIIFIVVLFKIHLALCDEICAHVCPENGVCLENDSDLCNGKSDCLFGSDESYVLCKTPLIGEMNHFFFCANGAAIEPSKRCNNHIDCADKSDESPAICASPKEWNNIIRNNGQCKENQLYCPMLTNNCTSLDKLCDKKIDCLNGRDESIEMCMTDHRYPFFQCGNGAMIDERKVCDNTIDCLDGADELLVHCESKDEWLRKTTAICDEPIENGLKFVSNITTMYAHNATHYFVYANGGVKFECYDANKIMKGHVWNVCMKDGTWHHELPKCVDKWSNRNPNTNGTYGCPIDTYDTYKKHLVIFQCLDDSTTCTKMVEPPINDMRVKFGCSNRYTLLPSANQNSTFSCRDKKWDELSHYTDPSCGKMCGSRELYCNDTMTPICKTSDARSVSCDLSSGLPPGTIATFLCEAGYKHRSERTLALRCSQEGKWENIYNVDRSNYCHMECGNATTATPYSRGAAETDVSNSPWSVALYIQNTSSRFNYSCGGVLIRHNFVLTAAHCISYSEERVIKNYAPQLFRVGPVTSNKQTVGPEHGWAVRRIKRNPSYFKSGYLFDTALMYLQTKSDMYFSIICLPNINVMVNDNDIITEGSIYAWDTNDIMADKPLRFTSVDAKIDDNASVRSDQFVVATQDRSLICIGDSGSGFFADCPRVNSVCLFGIVSSSLASDRTCSSDIKIISLLHDSNIQFITETIEQFSYTCD